jgi:hypothetical protein
MFSLSVEVKSYCTGQVAAHLVNRTIQSEDTSTVLSTCPSLLVATVRLSLVPVPQSLPYHLRHWSIEAPRATLRPLFSAGR